jgi:hypothetical protein
VGLGKGREKEDPLVNLKQQGAIVVFRETTTKFSFAHRSFFRANTDIQRLSFFCRLYEEEYQKEENTDFPSRAYDERNVCQLASDDDGAGPTNDATPERPATP